LSVKDEDDMKAFENSQKVEELNKVRSIINLLGTLALITLS